MTDKTEHRRSILPTILIPMRVKDDILATLRSMISGIEKVVGNNPDFQMDYLAMKSRPLLTIILTNWAISAIAADEWEHRASQLQSKLNQLENGNHHETGEERLGKLKKQE